MNSVASLYNKEKKIQNATVYKAFIENQYPAIFKNFFIPTVTRDAVTTINDVRRQISRKSKFILYASKKDYYSFDRGPA